MNNPKENFGDKLHALDLKLKLSPGWKEGPLPPGTYYWGGVVTKEMAESFSPGYRHGGFCFCDFCGDHVKVYLGNSEGGVWERIEAKNIAYYNNSIDLPAWYQDRPAESNS